MKQKKLEIKAVFDKAEINKTVAELKAALKQGFTLKDIDLKPFKDAFEDIGKNFAAHIRNAVSELKTVQAQNPGTRGGAISTSGKGVTIQHQGSGLDAKAFAQDFIKETIKYQRSHLVTFARLDARREKLKNIINANVSEVSGFKAFVNPQAVKNAELKAKLQAKWGTGQDDSWKFSNRDRRGDRRGAGKVPEEPSSSGANMMIAGGAISAGAYGAINLAQQYYEFKYKQIQDVAQGRILESISRQKGRGSMVGAGVGTGLGAVAGAGLGFKAGTALAPFTAGLSVPILTGAGALAGAGVGYYTGTRAMGELEVSKNKPIQAAFQRARGVRDAEIGAMAGLGQSAFTGEGRSNTIENMLSVMSARAAGQGYSHTQMLQALTQGGQTLGAAAFGQQTTPGKGIIEQALEKQRITGTSAGAQFSAGEIFTGMGAQRTEEYQEKNPYGAPGTYTSTRSVKDSLAGFLQTQQILKKGIAAGLDTSKTGQFLKTTADYVVAQTGYAQLDPADIADRLARRARGFAGDGPTTQIQLQQAARLEAQGRELGAQTQGGLASALNFMNVQEVAGDLELTPMELMALARTSGTKRGQEYAQKIFEEKGLTKKEALRRAEELRAGKTIEGVLGKGMGFLGSTGAGESETAKKGFLTTMLLPLAKFAEESTNIFKGAEGGDLLPSEGVLEKEGKWQGKTRQVTDAREEYKYQSEQITAGVAQFDISVQHTQLSLNELAEALSETALNIRRDQEELSKKVR